MSVKDYEQSAAPTAAAPRDASVSEIPPRIAVLIPCHNEELTVERVILDFRRELPSADICVFDNNSDDRTAELAFSAGARVIFEPRQGKGFVVSSMLNKIDADIYVMVDGDCTYPADRVHDLLAPILAGHADQTVGIRQAVDSGAKGRPMHAMGNHLVTALVNSVSRSRLTDVMSGYRVFTRELAQSVPVLSGGFDIETEFTLQCLEKGFVIREIPVPYSERPEGSFSKLSTYRDGFLVILRIGNILKNFRPMVFFGALSLGCMMLSLFCGYWPVMEYIREKYVHKVPLAALAGFLGTIAIGFLLTGVVLATINARFLEMTVLHRRATRARDGARR